MTMTTSMSTDHDHDHEGGTSTTITTTATTPTRCSPAGASRRRSQFTEEEIDSALHALDSLTYGQVVRAKGYVPADGGWLYFDYVPGERNLRRGEAAVTGRICVIGAHLDEDGLKELFDIA